jgi:hypothetical protein
MMSTLASMAGINTLMVFWYFKCKNAENSRVFCIKFCNSPSMFALLLKFLTRLTFSLINCRRKLCIGLILVTTKEDRQF